MNNIFNKLDQKEAPKEGFFHVESISDEHDHLLGLDTKKNIILLIKCKEDENINAISSRGEYLDILYQHKCKIKNEEKELEEVYTVLSMKSNGKILVNTFLNICEHILNELGQFPDLKETINTLESIKKLFSKLINKSSKTELGLWGELFLIYISKDYEYLIDSWHNKNTDTFDFNDGTYKIEVKSTTLSERKHNFSLQQLSDNISNKVVVCSIMTSQIDLGCSIMELVNKISKNLSVDYKLKLNEKIMSIAGKDIEIFKNKFDINTAKRKLKFYETAIIPSIKKEGISKDVSNIKFTSSLENIDSIDNIAFEKGLLSRIQ